MALCFDDAGFGWHQGWNDRVNQTFVEEYEKNLAHFIRDIRKDLDPIDLLRALIGVANVSTSPDWQQSARRLVDILIIGSRPG